MSGDQGTRVTVVDEHELDELPTTGRITTVLVEIPPFDPGTPPHRHHGPVYGYVIEGELIFELEGDPPRRLRAGDAVWEPGGDRIHYQAANPTPLWCRFVAVMFCHPELPMLTLVDAAELEARRDRRHVVTQLEGSARSVDSRSGAIARPRVLSVELGDGTMSTTHDTKKSNVESSHRQL